MHNHVMFRARARFLPQAPPVCVLQIQTKTDVLMCKPRLPSTSALHGGAATFEGKNAKVEGEIVYRMESGKTKTERK